MLIPINTDAPLYHFPIATILLIVANVVCFVFTGFAMNAGRLEPWMLEYGNGLNPLEWIPAAFAHAGFMHLIGNMFFLWGFGLVVEGKLGWKIFVPLYFALAAAWGAGIDVLTVHRTDNYVAREVGCESREDFVKRFAVYDEKLISEIRKKGIYLPVIDLEEEMLPTGLADKVLSALKGRCLGASGVIFSLLAISLIWAPKNELHIVGLLGYRLVSFDVTILTFSLWYLALNLIELLLQPVFGGMAMGSSGLHLTGAFIGFAVGILFLKLNWVDCEKWDLFAVLSGKYGRFAEEDWALGAHGRPDRDYSEIPLPEVGLDGEEQIPTRVRTAREKKTDQAISGVNSLIDAGDMITAADELFNLRLNDTGICPDQERMRRLATGLLQAQAFEEAEVWLQEYIDRFPEENSWARIRMAQVLLTQLRRPNAALQELKGLRLSELPEQMQSLAKKIAATAKHQVRSGIRDAEPEW